jgi:transposase
MAYKFKAYDQNQMFLLPPSIRDWVEEGSLVCFINDAVDDLEARGWLQSFYERFRSDGLGAWSYHPKMMVKIWLYAYALGVQSCRKIARLLAVDVGFRYLAANQQPNFRTIASFRQLNSLALGELFVSVLELCKEAGLVKLGLVALDGRRVQTNAALSANHKAKSLRRQIQGFFDEADDLDAEEDELYGVDKRGDELPEGLRTKSGRLRRLGEALDRLEKEAEEERARQEAKIAERKRRGSKGGSPPKAPEQVGKEKLEKAQANVTDPESRIMKTKRGYIQGLGGQAMVDCQSQVVVAQAVTQDAHDSDQLGPMLERCEWQAGGRPKGLLGDLGYWSEANARLEDAETELFIATTKDWKQAKALREAPPPRGRIPASATPRERMERKLRTKRGREAYRHRSATVEPVFGQMVTRGLGRFFLRGLERVSTEWSLWCTTHNLLKLWRSGWQPAIA